MRQRARRVLNTPEQSVSRKLAAAGGPALLPHTDDFEAAAMIIHVRRLVYAAGDLLHRHALDVQLDGETAELLGASLEGETIAVDIGDLVADARSGSRSLSYLVRGLHVRKTAAASGAAARDVQQPVLLDFVNCSCKTGCLRPPRAWCQGLVWSIAGSGNEVPPQRSNQADDVQRPAVEVA